MLIASSPLLAKCRFKNWYELETYICTKLSYFLKNLI